MGSTTTDSSKEECRKILRRMELEAYGAVVSTLRAQGELTKDRKKLLEDLSVVMKISPERHKAEIRRAVNDEKLSLIAERLSGADTEWAWAMEGRRVVPLMPRLVRPTHFTSLASAVTKAAAQNPKIYQPHQCVINPSSSKDETPAKYVRDPDDEDTLSPVMVPIASPESSCHSNNNVDTDMPETPSERRFFTFNKEDEKKLEATPKRPPVPTQPPPMKRPRSPISQVVNSPAPLPKIRAVSPNCIRPPPKPITPLQQTSSQITPRMPIVNQIRPPVQQLPTPTPAPSVPASASKIRVRAPLVQNTVPRPTTINRPPVTQYSQVQVSQPRPPATPAAKQVVQIRAASASHSLPSNQQTKDVTTLRTVQAHAPVTVQTIPNVASGLAKPLPGKANVIVLHKNSAMAKTITTAAREGDRGVINKANFLQKTVNTSSGTKVTFPSNVRIISVPSGTNVVSSTGGVSLNHTALTQKIVTNTNTGTSAQKNVYVLELSNETVGKSIILGDIVPANLISEVNGNSVKPTTPTTITLKEEREDKGKTTPKEVASEAPTSTQELAAPAAKEPKIARTETQPIEQARDVIVTKDVATFANNGNHVEGQVTCSIKQEEACAPTTELDPQTGLLYTMTEQQTTRGDVEQPTVDIFSTAIASADIDMDSSAFANDADMAGGTQLILTDAFDTSSAKS